MSSPDSIPKHYDFREVESRWLEVWKDEDFYFDRKSSRPQFIIDTPPPYPTGNFHIGNALNWCYIDFLARYKRMKGYNVMFPQGWDCHGLPTEVKVEEIHNITKNDVSRTEFREMCRELTLKNIGKMRGTMRRMAFSVDWSNEYITMMPEYFGKTQLSFLKMFGKGDIYQTEHPVNFCTRCETAIAFAEVSYEDRTTRLNFFDFDGVEIATTRPELLVACVAVAVHPEDGRFSELKGKMLKVPLFGHEVPVIWDEAVDPEFGSGAVMICTFGDKQDVQWWKVHGLPLRKAIDKKGRMTAIAGKYEGMTSGECRDAVLAEMENEGILIRQEPLEQRVGCCWRCKTPIEILSERQWFLKIHHDEIIRQAKKIAWYPEHMYMRLENWTRQMEWDWCISRQRLFATPIPVWQCSSCGEIIIPGEEDLPVDPTVDLPKEPCPACGSTEFTGETDVLDTWMDSSISVLNITGWDGSSVPVHFPAQIRPQGHDIIRTWAFYTILRANALTGKQPWEQILINGMVLGEDGFKMSKSRDNIIPPEEIIDQYGADALRQWGAAGAATGSDIMFSWNDVVAASRFQTKMWNIVRFITGHLNKEDTNFSDAPLVLADRWLLSKLTATVTEVTSAMESYQFDRAIKTIREFARDCLADNYIELVKGRLYSDSPDRSSACRALSVSLDAVCRMLAPFVPFFAEECYSLMRNESVHGQPWVEINMDDSDSGLKGDLLVNTVSEIRRWKHDRGMALNAPVGNVAIYSPYSVDDAGDAGQALNAVVEWVEGKPELEEVMSGIKFNMGVIGPALRKNARAFMDAAGKLSPAEIQNPPKTVNAECGELEVPEGAFEPEFSYQVAGKDVEVITVGDCVITISGN